MKGPAIRPHVVLGFAAAIATGVDSRAAESQPPGDALQEVVVTAERRPESLNEIPIAATVISGQTLQAKGVSTIDDLPMVAPAINIQNQQALSYVNIRGVGLQATNPTTSSGVAAYSDGLFIPHETAIADEYYDVGQIEILRGPQGTLVGQNSTGGAIFVTSTRPSTEATTGYVTQSRGNFGFTKTEAAFNAPIGSDLAVRFAGNFYDRDSFYDDLHIGGAPDSLQLQPGNATSWSGRIGVAWQPEANLKIYLKYETTTRNGDGYAGKDYGELAGANNAVDSRLSQPFTISYDQPSWDKYQMTRTSAEVSWDITDELTLRSLTGYQHDDINNQFDNDQTYLPLSWASQTFDEVALQQELNLYSKSPGPFNWIVGAFFLRDQTPTYLHLYTAPPGPPPTFTIETQPLERAYALFGQATYRFAEKWQLQLGVRGTRDEKDQTGTQVLEIPTGLPAPAPPIVNVPVPLTASTETTTPTGKAALSFFPAPDATAYVSAARGFKPGGANAGDFVSLVFRPEKINAYEAGYKASFNDHRVSIDAAAFYYDYTDMQTNAIDASGQRAIINVPKSEIYGAEAEAQALFGNLTVSGGGSYNHSAVAGNLLLIDSGNPFVGPQDLQGRTLPYAPQWTANAGATYGISTAAGRLALTGQYAYTSTAYATLFQLAPRDLLGSHSLINATASMTFNNRIRLELYGTNLNNALYAAGTIGNNSAVWGAPRQYGARIGYAF